LPRRSVGSSRSKPVGEVAVDIIVDFRKVDAGQHAAGVTALYSISASKESSQHLNQRRCTIQEVAEEIYQYEV